MGIALFAAPVPATAGLRPVADAAPCPQDHGLSQLVSQSRLIVVATPRVPADLAGAKAYVDIVLDEAVVLKGALPRPLMMHYYPSEDGFSPAPASVADASGQRMILFLQAASANDAALYFAGYTPNALRAALPAEEAAIRTEVARQSALLLAASLPVRLAHLAEVRGLIERLRRGGLREKDAVIARFEALGAAAIPAIVASLDDRRVLADPNIRFRNRAADAFEAYAQYGPERVIDALDAILGDIAEDGSGTLHNGGTEAARQAALDGWRVYAADMACR